MQKAGWLGTLPLANSDPKAWFDLLSILFYGLSDHKAWTLYIHYITGLIQQGGLANKNEIISMLDTSTIFRVDLRPATKTVNLLTDNLRSH